MQFCVLIGLSYQRLHAVSDYGYSRNQNFEETQARQCYQAQGDSHIEGRQDGKRFSWFVTSILTTLCF